MIELTVSQPQTKTVQVRDWELFNDCTILQSRGTGVPVVIQLSPATTAAIIADIQGKASMARPDIVAAEFKPAPVIKEEKPIEEGASK